MKNILLAALLLIPFAISAQTVKFENDTIYKDGKAYGLIIKTGKMANVTFSVKTLTNVEIAVVKFDEATSSTPNATDGYYRFTFMGSGAFGHFHPASMNVGKGIAQVVVENDLIKDNAVNPEGEKRFLVLYPSQLKNQPTVIVNVNTNSPDYTPVQRNKSGSVSAINGQLSQGGVNIGTYSTSDNFSGGKSVSTTTYSLPNGVQCAVATYDNIGAKSATVRTMRDNATHTVTIKNSAMSEDEIANWLSVNGYL